MTNDQVKFAERVKAFSYHLVFSILLLLVSIVFIFFIWYPGALIYATGVLSVYAMLLAIDLILGPLLTALVYKKHKIKFIFDTAIILIIQIAAFVFGLYTLEKGRPAWLVFVINDFEIVAKSDLESNVNIPKAFEVKFWNKPIWVAAVYSDDPEIHKRQKEDEIFNGLSITKRPENYMVLESKYLSILSESKNIYELKKYNELTVDQNMKLADAQAWLPLKAPEKDLVILIDEEGKPTKIVNLRPWL